ncbi:MAG TPA: hypothetical protein PLJ27_10745 [Polyangiaceae bacterium]|nr:hypothetical protein [Polyangiaceae bacterium]
MSKSKHPGVGGKRQACYRLVERNRTNNGEKGAIGLRARRHWAAA